MLRDGDDIADEGRYALRQHIRPLPWRRTLHGVARRPYFRDVASFGGPLVQRVAPTNRADAIEFLCHSGYSVGMHVDGSAYVQKGGDRRSEAGRFAAADACQAGVHCLAQAGHAVEPGQPTGLFLLVDAMR